MDHVNHVLVEDEKELVEENERLRQNRFSTRLNSGFKWQVDKSVVGAMEVQSKPYFDPSAKMKEQAVVDKEESFKECCKLWKEFGMRKSFIEAVEMIPPKTTCFGLINNDSKTVRNIVPLLNQGWCSGMNEKIKDRGYKISCFVWSWNNVTGHSKSVVLLIRFHRLTAEDK